MTSAVAYILFGVVLLAIGAFVVASLIRRRNRPRTFDGDFVLSFETSSFTPRDKPEARYWLAWGPDVKLMERLQALGFDKTHAEARLRFEGRLETGAKDGYGHLGRYTGQVTILRLLDATRENPRS